tara:strand:+ start:2356 stop:3387 length:1032 start_codon:yes stop_codon:yes gene_type:complete
MKKFFTLREAELFSHRKIGNKVFDWLQAAAEDGFTFKKNFEDLSKVKIKPTFLAKIKKINTLTDFYGHKISSPLILSPMGHQTQFHKDGEIETAKGVAKANTIAFFGTQGRISLDDIRKKNKKLKIGWTIFPFGNREWIKKEVRSAEKNKCIAITICIDANIRSQRYLDLEARYDARTKGRRTNPLPQNPKLALDYDWNLISFIKKITKLPIIVKGILTSGDMKKALKFGADGLWISNHGGRMFNSGISSVEALIDIKKKLKTNKKIKIIVDGGVRKGTDVIKLLCLGADFVGIGRPAIYGLIYNGNNGVEDIFRILNNEIKTSMINGGFKSINSFSRNRVYF